MDSVWSRDRSLTVAGIVFGVPACQRPYIICELYIRSLTSLGYFILVVETFLKCMD